MRPLEPATLVVIAVGGVIGALARHAATIALPQLWSTFVVNVTGCLLIGALMAVVAGVPRAPRLLRPFLGVGVLGGFTTFSAYIVDIQQTLGEGRPFVAFAYLAITLVSALAAVYAGGAVTTAVLGLVPPPAAEAEETP
ncbi:fluoride efflux transporter FluC [Sinosporangium siamense]|uniref:Fluoride-specific ion channel FluC n=1 Tax=Sinosporangium siamense TaxID=1367973 RepID=A0A919RLP7_9ACTN|nr:CrcB family protein [Sinosporangium siamense]GII94724.1 putative fluoride ion transporter CrcB [Sinosporangium siamense]